VGGNNLSENVDTSVACSRLSDSGKDTKVKGTRKVGRAKKGKRKEERA